jgi:hypothetical protein
VIKRRFVAVDFPLADPQATKMAEKLAATQLTFSTKFKAALPKKSGWSEANAWLLQPRSWYQFGGLKENVTLGIFPFLEELRMIKSCGVWP